MLDYLFYVICILIIVMCTSIIFGVVIAICYVFDIDIKKEVALKRKHKEDNNG